jgi:hypothetical protein
MVERNTLSRPLKTKQIDDITDCSMPDDAEPNYETSELLTQNKRSRGVSYYVFSRLFCGAF